MSADVADDNELEHWRNKCRELEKVVKTLSSHCFKVVEKHEDLLGKYKTNQEQYEKLAARLKETEEQLSKMRKLYEPVCSEFEEMKNKIEIEMECRQHAEEYASQVTKQNKVLKRQSQMLQQHAKGVTLTTEINIDDEIGNEDESQKQYLAALNDKIIKLEEDNATVRTELSEAREDLQIECDKKKTYSYQNESLKAELNVTKQSLKQHQDALKRLADASESAFHEYERLKGNYQQEILCRDKAEKYAATLFAEKEAAKRQSNMLMMNVASDRKLMEAMIEVENLTARVEEQKAQYEQQISDLEQEVKALKEKDSLESLEEENTQLTEERDSVYKQLATLEASCAAIREDYDTLQKKYKALEEKLEEAKRPPPPPPAPPPPPPPTKKLNIFNRGKKKKEAIQKKLEVGGAAPSADYSKALEEMMKRIREGTPLKRTLKPPRRPSCPDETDGTAMTELKGMLSKMKKASSEGDLLAALPKEEDSSSELQKAFLRVRKRSLPDTDDGSHSKQDEVSARGQDRPVPKPRGAKPLSIVSETDEEVAQNEKKQTDS